MQIDRHTVLITIPPQPQNPRGKTNLYKLNILKVPFTASGQETDRAYSTALGAHMLLHMTTNKD